MTTGQVPAQEPPTRRPGSRLSAEALLRQADAVLRQVQPKTTAAFQADGWSFRVRWVYPGPVVVSLRNEGVVIVQSRSGQPTKPAKPRNAHVRPPGLPANYPWPWEASRP